ncbi:MAG TPA: nickel-binding protein [Candidatus Limnocylindria bacterium]|jgi:class 3 adenylate cyclase|nr:nickel-binding protein [Candidatus Limnocylindria bacterium]
MTLYMDRHDVRGITAEQVAQAHLLDLEASPRHHVEFLTYWFDEANNAAFCLAKAPSADAMQAVHREAHGLVSNDIIRVSEDNVLRFLGRIENPLDAAHVTNPFRTVLFTDVEGSTSLLNELGQGAYLLLLTEHDLVIRRALLATHGREVKHTGDGIMAAFEEVADGLRCAVAIQEGFERRNAESGPPLLRVRIGIAAGEPVDRDNDLFGSTVNLASRICQAADGGQVLVADQVRKLAEPQGFVFSPAGRHVLKGFPGRVALYQLDHDAREP